MSGDPRTDVTRPVLLSLVMPGPLQPSNAVACNGCGALVLNNPNAKAMHLDWHEALTAPQAGQHTTDEEGR